MQQSMFYRQAKFVDSYHIIAYYVVLQKLDPPTKISKHLQILVPLAEIGPPISTFIIAVNCDDIALF